jgi:hypothetical protein
MAQKTLKDEAKDYKPSKITKNISELQSISTDLVIEDDSFEFDGKEIKQKIVEVAGETYRVPVSVIRDLKVILDDNPNLKTFKVKKTGQGMETRYTLIPLS